MNSPAIVKAKTYKSLHEAGSREVILSCIKTQFKGCHEAGIPYRYPMRNSSYDVLAGGILAWLDAEGFKIVKHAKKSRK